MKIKDRPAAGFATMPTRVAGELDARLEAAARGLSFHNSYLDDRLRLILPNDLIIFTASSGAGKTQSVLDVASRNAENDYRVGYFALEAEPRELERRAKYRWLALEAWAHRLHGVERLNYTDWYIGRCEDIVGELNSAADEWFLSKMSTLWTYYKGHGDFDADRMAKEIEEIARIVDLVILDHLHYVDGKDGESENRALTKIAKTLRDSALALGRPVIAVAHLRKQFGPIRKLLPDKEDIMGPSDIFKVTTQIIAFARARFIEPPRWWLSPTLIGVIKDRREGEDDLAALTYYDTRTRTYAERYTLGRLVKNGTEWEALAPGDVPRWATRHQPMEVLHPVDNSPTVETKSPGVDFAKRTKKGKAAATPTSGQPVLSSDDEWSARMSDEPGWEGGHQ